MKCSDVARQIGTSPPKVKAMLQTGRFDWGAVVKGSGRKDRILIFPEAYKRWYADNFGTQEQR